MSKPRRNRSVDVAVITGLSGAGRSEAANALEDLGWYVIDNLPPALITKTLELALAPGNDIASLALVIDARGGSFFDEAADALKDLRREVSSYRMLFLEADDEVLVRRFEATRRKHPLAIGERVVVGIQRERDLLKAFRDGADLILDTTDLSVRDLRTRLAAAFGGPSPADGLKTTVISFGYKFGLPLDSDIVLDVRFLPNPYWVEGLRALGGGDDRIREYVLGQDASIDFLERTKDLFAVLLPGFEAEGRHYLTVAVGCTGGRHRSVVLADEIASWLGEKGYAATVIHRDLERAAATP
ncbi:MAG TPA: RNase adapter RapZ [Actinomycetota bacterium]|nr:RNase adapter RapZ [Actinomycetota bacterium]